VNISKRLSCKPIALRKLRSQNGDNVRAPAQPTVICALFCIWRLAGVFALTVPVRR
jgi:hypothetical protein